MSANQPIGSVPTKTSNRMAYRSGLDDKDKDKIKRLNRERERIEMALDQKYERLAAIGEEVGDILQADFDDRERGRLGLIDTEREGEMPKRRKRFAPPDLGKK